MWHDHRQSKTVPNDQFYMLEWALMKKVMTDHISHVKVISQLLFSNITTLWHKLPELLPNIKVSYDFEYVES